MVTLRLQMRASDFYPDIRTLRPRRRGLETESRTTLAGHEGGNPGYGQGKAYGPPRQSSTRPVQVMRAMMER